MGRMIPIPVRLVSIGLASVSSGQPPKKASVRPVVSWRGAVADGKGRAIKASS